MLWNSKQVQQWLTMNIFVLFPSSGSITGIQTLQLHKNWRAKKGNTILCFQLTPSCQCSLLSPYLTPSPLQESSCSDSVWTKNKTRKWSNVDLRCFLHQENSGVRLGTGNKLPLPLGDTFKSILIASLFCLWRDNSIFLWSSYPFQTKAKSALLQKNKELLGQGWKPEWQDNPYTSLTKGFTQKVITVWNHRVLNMSGRS